LLDSAGERCHTVDNQAQSNRKDSVVSDYNPLMGDGPPEDSPEILGEAVGDGQPTDPPVERAYLEVDQVADRYVRVKVDGEEHEVPLSEALQGYSRQADYTRKTQELAQQRQQAEYALTLQRALQTRPRETLSLLANEYGINFNQQSPPPQQREQPSYYDDGLDEPTYSADPIDRRLTQQEQMLKNISQQLAHRQADEQLRAAIGGLQQKYQLDDATARQVVGTALQANMGPESFEMIYKNIAFDRAQQVRAAAQAQRTEQTRQRETAKERSSQLVGNGGSAASAGGPRPGPSDGHVSIQEAFGQAWDEVVGR
jgi:hypothetical protein